jgi:hypothetical protein
MASLFSKVIKEREYIFEQVFYGADLKYHVTEKDSNPRVEFRMYKDENGQWKIHAQALPNYVWANELEFNDAIEEQD